MTEKQFRWFVSSLVVFATLLAYANTFANDFVWDDASSIILHQHVQDPSKVLQLFTEDQHHFGRGEGNFYRPLVSLSFMVEYWLSRPAGPGPDGTATTPQILSPYLFHLDNALWHALAVLAFFALLTLFNAPRFVRVAAPLLYAVHPLHTEAVAYISGRADSMAAAFVIFALWAALNPKLEHPTIITALLFTAGLLSKESAAIFPFLLLFALLAAKRSERKAGQPSPPILPLIVSGAMLGAYAGLRMTILHFGNGGGSVSPPLATRLLQAGQAFALYLKLMFIPTGLHMERTLDGVPVMAGIVGWVLALALLALAVVALLLKRSRLGFAIGFFIITWVPISGIFPLNAPMAEHWMYLPMIGFSWALLEVVWKVAGSNPLRYVAYPAVYAACVVLILITAERNHDWKNNESLYAATLEMNPKSIRVNYNLGVTYQDLTGNPSGARRHYERVLALYKERKAVQGETDKVYYDDEMEAHLSLGELYAKESMPDLAAPHFEVLRRLEVNERNAPVVARAYVAYAQLLLNAGRPDDASSLLKEGAERVPGLKEQFEAVQRSRASGSSPAAPANNAAQTTVPEISNSAG